MATYDVFRWPPPPTVAVDVGSISHRHQYDVFPFVAADSTAPVITDVTPAAGTQLNYASGVMGFKATDPSGNLTRAPTILAFYPEIRRFEVVHFSNAFPEFGGGFAPDYLGSVVPVAGGFQFSDLLRRGGWPSRPTFVIDAVDASGNLSG